MAVFLFASVLGSWLQAVPDGDLPRQRLCFDDGWRFHLGHASDPAKDFGFGTGHPWAKAGEAVGAVRPDFNDGDWRKLDLPHDWVVELDFAPGGSPDHMAHGFKPVGREYPDTTIGWYRKRFEIPKEDEGRRITIEFDGVFRDCHVWLNGHLIGHNESGYIGFNVDATDVLNYGGENVLVVRVDASHYEGWFYEGAGIYRHVWLTKTNPVHIAKWGTFVHADGIQLHSTSQPASGSEERSPSGLTREANEARVWIETLVINDSSKQVSAEVESLIIHGMAPLIAKPLKDGVVIEAHSRMRVLQSTYVKNFEPWSVAQPRLNLLVSTVRVDGRLVDEYRTSFGIRSVRFDQDQGLLLNGEPVKIKGVCCHQDHAGVGSALPDGLQYDRIRRLKEMGANAYRCAHHPPTPELLEACDEVGMLVMDEQRLIGSSEEILDQVRRMVRRDRNHPSVILWSIGNEEPEQASPTGKRIAETMKRTISKLDSTRPVTYASNAGNAYEGMNEVVDVRGFNYLTISDIDKYHREHPEQTLFGSEEASTVSTRGEYVVDKERGYLTAYDLHKPGRGALAEEWMKFYMTRPFLAGAFVWTGFDYRGEPTPYGWPCISSHFGIMDTCGFPKDLYYYYQSWWTDRPVLHLFPHWNWAGKEGQPIDVWCFTNLESVRLRLNGRDLGEKPVERHGHVEWRVPYEPGTLEATGFREKKEVLITRVATTGPAAKLIISADYEATAADGKHLRGRALGTIEMSGRAVSGDEQQWERSFRGVPEPRKDLYLFTVSVRDAEDRLVPTADNEVFFDIEGPGEIIGVGNGDPSSHERDRFVARTVSQRIEGWEMAPGGSFTTKPPTHEELETRGGTAVDVSRDADAIRQNNAFATYWARFIVDEKDIAAGMKELSIGCIDDHGQIFLNGSPVGETHAWDRAHRFDVGGLLKAGPNDLVIIVKNDQGPGGLGGGISLGGGIERPQVHRRLFNGLCQVIVQSTEEAGAIRLLARAEGLESSAVEVQTSQVRVR